MSRFTSRIDEMIGKKPKDNNQADIDRIEKEVDDGLTNDPVKKQIAQKAKKKRQDLLKSLDEAEGDDFVPRQGPETGGEFEPKSKDDLAQEPSEEPTPDPMTTEGETFYVNLARKALFVDLDNTSLTDAEREIVTQDVEPANAKEVAKVLRKIVVDAGLSENFDSKIDSVWEDLQLSDLRSKLSLELKKNDRVVVLVPGSFKPPHKGHYEMVKTYSEMYPSGQVHVLISAPSAKSERRTKDGKLITPAAAKQIFELYAQPLNNVTVSISEYPSPVTTAYETLKTLDDGTTVVLGASKKDGDWKRWSYAKPWAEKEGLDIEIVEPEESAVDVTLKADGTPYSASNIRDNFDDFEKIKADIPEHVSPEAVKQVFDSLS
jgi:hypothetical protein